MDRTCGNCYWFKPNAIYSDKVTCLDSFEKVMESDTCMNFCKEEDYVPTGIWAEMAKVVEAVAQEVRKREPEVYDG